MYGYFIASVSKIGKSAEEVEEETLRVMNANGGLGRRYLRWDDESEYRKIYFEIVK